MRGEVGRGEQEASPTPSRAPELDLGAGAWPYPPPPLGGARAPPSCSSRSSPTRAS